MEKMNLTFGLKKKKRPTKLITMSKRRGLKEKKIREVNSNADIQI